MPLLAKPPYISRNAAADTPNVPFALTATAPRFVNVPVEPIEIAPPACTVMAVCDVVIDAVLLKFDPNGNLLWETRLNDVSSSSPISYAVDGKQYVAIVVGEGGFHARSFAPLVPEFRSPPNRGATLWVFALPN